MSKEEQADALASAITERLNTHIEAFSDTHGRPPSCIFASSKLLKLLLAHEYDGIPLLVGEHAEVTLLYSPARYIPRAKCDPYADDFDPTKLLFGEDEGEWKF